MAVTLGVQNLCSAPERLATRRAALLTNFTGVMPDLTRNVEALVEAEVPLVALLGPEHGLRGVVQAGFSEPDSTDARSRLPVLETYGRGVDLADVIGRSDADMIIFDMQDIGVRYYTYVWSMFDAMCVAARLGLSFAVLDRPNPLGGTVVSGPGVQPDLTSFVGRVDLPLRHGLTTGELAQLFNQVHVPTAAGRPVNLTVVPMTGWKRADDFDNTGLCWVAPSPNIPTLESAYLFCATGLVEGTTLSEGRGTTLPFQLIGAPYVDGRLADALRDADLAGLAVQDAAFVPMFHKHADTVSYGVRLCLTDRTAFDPVGTGLTLLQLAAGLYPDDFVFLAPRTAGKAWAIDRLWGSTDLRTGRLGSVDTTVRTPPEVYPADVLIYR